jgi:hypothetical protein
MEAKCEKSLGPESVRVVLKEGVSLFWNIYNKVHIFLKGRCIGVFEQAVRETQ